MISSKELLARTGLSRATLNNYIKLGLMPRPEVRTGEGAEDGAARLGFFPESAVARVETIKNLRQQGVSMDQMAAYLDHDEGSFGSTGTVSIAPVKLAEHKRKARFRAVDSLPNLTIEAHDSPAYLVNNRLELIWWNDSAALELFGDPDEMPGELDMRGLFPVMLPSLAQALEPQQFDEFVYLHIIAAKRRLNDEQLLSCVEGLSSDLRHKVEDILSDVEEVGSGQVMHFGLEMPRAEEGCYYSDLYVSYFREGILFTLDHADTDGSGVRALLAQRSSLIAQLMRNRKPHVTPLVVMVADLQNSVNICSELPAEEYFELINQVWQEAEPIFRQYRGSYGKHAGDGMVYYFFPQPDEDYKLNALRCALELQQMMRRLTQTWQQRKGWFNDLYLNIGLHEGREWFGAYHAGSHVEFTVLGDTVNYASRLSDFSTNGSIYATKSLINGIPSQDRKHIHYGVYRASDRGEKQLVVNSYASIRNLAPELCQTNPKYRDIEMLPITEVLSLGLKTLNALS